jgi:hypothetical protein
MASRGRPKKILGRGHDIYVQLSKEELHGLLRLIAKRFDEKETEPSKQDLIREAVRDLLLRESLLPVETHAAVPAPVSRDKRLQ